MKYLFAELSAKTVVMILLVMICMVSAISVVIVRHQNRLAFVDLQKEQKHYDYLQQEWGRLRLEYTTWAATQHLYDEAKEKFAMLPPNPENIVTVVLQENGTGMNRSIKYTGGANE